ncbi:MAG: polyprenyl synthetase family protein [Deltaproteobacteria bacterium]|nr:polyprenyl synthetase family protein [Deltaproteobacteria bacterium]
MDLEKYLAGKTEAVNRGLSALLVKEGDYPQSLHRAMHYSLFAGGKRLRPTLVLASAESVGADPDSALNIACAFECIHTYSLIHDDLPAIDNDDLRRGRPTCHKVFGEAGAILAGDALLTAAFEIAAGTPIKDKGAVIRAIAELAKAAGSTGMIGGQAVDIESEGKEVPFPVLEYIHIHKTGELILAAVRCGAIIGGAADEELAGLTRYGQAAGLAFQIADDILDVEGSSLEMGKATGGDEKKGKATYPSVIGMEESKKRAAELVGMALEALSGFDGKADPLRAIARYIVSRRK